MTEFDQRLGGSGDEMQSLDETISAILYLGERLAAPRPEADERRRSEPYLDADEAAGLFRAIEGEIIPRLMLAHRSPEPVEAPTSGGPELVCVTAEDRERFLEKVLNDSATASSSLVDELLERGVSRETLFLDLLANTARRLGELWEEDRCDFTDVTIGLCRLHQVLRERSTPSTRMGLPLGLDAPRILLSTACADQHVFGVVMVAEFFRREGWHVWSEPGAARSTLVDLLAEERFDVLGLSAACSALSEEVAEEVEALRRASKNLDLRVLVGGRLFAEAPDLVSKVGADGAAFDARTAPAAAKQLIARSDIPC